MSLKRLSVRISIILSLVGLLLLGNHVKIESNSAERGNRASQKVLVASKSTHLSGVRHTRAFANSKPKAIPQIVPIFTYHYIDPKLHNYIAISPDMFEQQLKLLADNGYQTISLDDLYSHLVKGTPLPQKPVILTFDDNRKDQLIYAIPLLKKYNFKATFFVYCEAATWNSHAFMNEAEIANIGHQGFEVENHTWSHASLARDADPVEVYNVRISKELVDSKTWLEKITGKNVNYLAYPYGFYDCWAMKAASDKGYKLALTVDEGTNILEAQPNLALKRFVIARDTTPADFMDRLQSKPLYIVTSSPPGASVIEDTQPVVSAILKNTGNESTPTLYFQIDGKAVKAFTTSTETDISTSIANRIALPHGFHTVVVKGRTKQGNLAVTSWSFYIKGN